jgi:hypothetical protein
MNIIVKRKLKDFKAWKKLVSEMDGVRQAYGSQGMTAYQNASESDYVFLVFDWVDN